MNRLNKLILGGLLAGSTLGGVAYGTTLSGSANAATTSTTAPSATAPSATAPSSQAPAFDPSKGGHTANGKTETLLTGTDADKAKAAALAALPGATIQRVETDAEGAAYEAHVTKSDGTSATVEMDADFKVTNIETGGPNGSGGPGHGHGGPSTDDSAGTTSNAPTASSTSTSTGA